MFNKENGFAPLILLAAVVMIGAVCAVGWFVYSNQSGQNRENEPEVNQASVKSDTYEGWQTYSDDRLKFAVKYPSDWNAVTNDEEGFFNAILSAPGTTRSNKPFEDLKDGAMINLYCSETSYVSLEESHSNTPSEHNRRDQKMLKVNGVDARQYIFAYEGPEYRKTEFLVDQKRCTISIETKAYKQSQFAKTYDRVVSSVTF